MARSAPLPESPTVMDVASLNPQDVFPYLTSPIRAFCGDAEDANRLVQLADAVLSEKQLIVTGAKAPLLALDWLLQTVPITVRERVAVSVGVTFSRARRLGLCFADGESSEMKRATRGHPIDCVHVSALPEPTNSPLADWYDFVRQHAATGRFVKVGRITSKLTGKVEPRTLSRLAALCRDTELAMVADDDVKEMLHQKYQRYRPADDLERELTDQIMLAVEPKPADV